MFQILWWNTIVESTLYLWQTTAWIPYDQINAVLQIANNLRDSSISKLFKPGYAVTHGIGLN